MPDTNRSDAQAVIDAARRGVQPVQLDPGAIYSVLDSDGLPHFLDTDEWADRPRRVHRNVKVQDAASFTGYLAARVGPDNVTARAGGLEIWADVETRAITAVLDGGAGWSCDTATLILAPSPEWSAWAGKSGAFLTQAAFAEFVEDNLDRIVDPPGADLLEIAQTLQGTIRVAWAAAERLADGSRTLAWSEDADTKAGRKGRLTLPAQITAALRPFAPGPAFKVVAALRHRIGKDGLAVGFKLRGADDVVAAAFADVVAEVEKTVGGPILKGRP
jgi:hypothetical protein